MNDEKFNPRSVYSYIRPVQKRRQNTPTNEENTSNSWFRKIDGVTDNFVTVMESLLQYAQQGLEVSCNSIDNNLHGYYSELMAILRAPHKKRAKFEMVIGFMGEKSTERQYVVPIQDLGHAFKVNDYLSTAIAAPTILCSSLLQQLVNTWEGFIGNCLATQMESQRKLISGKLMISYEAVRNIRDVADLHRLAIEQTTGEVLRQSTKEQLASFKTYFGVDLLSFLKDTKRLEEIVFRRHMLVHCDGLATATYCKQVVKLGYDEPKIGESLSPSYAYLLGAWDEIFSTGSIIAHLIKCQSRREGAKIDIDKLYGRKADGALLAHSYMALEKKRFVVVRRLGEYARQRRLNDEWAQKALLVNFALACKHTKDEKSFKAILAEMDEHSWPSDFMAPIACLKGNFDQAFQIVRRGCKQRDCSKAKEAIRQLTKWPVYEELRKTDKCMAFLNSAEVQVKIAECEKTPPKIDFGTTSQDPDVALKELYDLCEMRKSSLA